LHLLQYAPDWRLRVTTPPWPLRPRGFLKCEPTLSRDWASRSCIWCARNNAAQDSILDALGRYAAPVSKNDHLRQVSALLVCIMHYGRKTRHGAYFLPCLIKDCLQDPEQFRL